MFRRYFSVFLFAIIIIQLTNRVNSSYEDKVVKNCQIIQNAFAEKEDQYTPKSQSDPTVPQLFVRPFFVQQPNAFDLEQDQRTFECIADTLKVYSDVELQSSNAYRSLVKECQAKHQPTPQCDTSYPYRTVSGICNNLLQPKLGSTFHCFRRLWPANYDGASGLRRSVEEKQPLPNTRHVSRKLIKNDIKLTRDYNCLFAFFGQVMAHDIAQFPFSTIRGNKTIACCEDLSKEGQHPQCAPILLDQTDEFYVSKNFTCFDFVRVVPCGTCSVEKRVPINYVSGWLDLSIIYGPTSNRAKLQRKYDGSGKLRSRHTAVGELPPANRKLGSRCGDVNKKQYCYNAGDPRAQQQIPLAISQTLLLREHNRIAEELEWINPQWDEETLFQEARKILIAEYQVIVYNEYLPILLGQEIMSKYGLNIGSKGSYDPSMDATISVEFNAAAFRIHSILPSKVVFDEEFELLRYLFTNLIPIYNDRMSVYLDKLVNNPAEKYDRFMPLDVTQFVYRRLNGTYGFDLFAVDVQRGRDVGLPTYVQTIENMQDTTGIIETFDDLEDYIQPECLNIFPKLYANVRDIDLFVGLLCEKKTDGMIISLTAAHIIAEQYQRLKYGDRFYVEYDRTLTKEQRTELLNASMAKLICDNSKVDAIQRMAFLFPSAKNVPTFCSSIPGVNLEKWKVKP